MDRNEKVNELIARAEKAGLRLQFDSGLVLVKRTESGDPDGQRAIIAELWRYLGEVRHLVEAHAIGERAKGLAGRPIWCEFGPGTLLGGGGGGALRISTSQEMRLAHEEEAHRSKIAITCDAKALLIILDEEGVDVASSSDGQQAPERPKTGFFERLARRG